MYDEMKSSNKENLKPFNRNEDINQLLTSKLDLESELIYLKDESFNKNLYSLFELSPLIDELIKKKSIKRKDSEKHFIKNIPKKNHYVLLYDMVNLAIEIIDYVIMLCELPDCLKDCSDPVLFNFIIYPLEKILLDFE